MRSESKTLPFAFALSAHKCTRSLAQFRLTRPAQTSWSPRPWHQVKSAGPIATAAEPLSIYAVDDHPSLTELYAGSLQELGYVVRAFDRRVDALAALKTERGRPVLLITDYRGLSMPVNQFIEACRSIYPNLRILMASGFNEHEMQFCRVRPDRFIQKPFTLEQLQQTVSDLLVTTPLRTRPIVRRF